MLPAMLPVRLRCPRVLTLAALHACSGPTSRDAATTAGIDPQLRREVPLARALPAGTVLRPLLDAATLPPGISERALLGLWREALHQSAHLDIAGEPMDGPAAAVLRLSFDAGCDAFAATLGIGEQDTHIALVRGYGPDLPAALDELALRARLALGDPVAAAPAPLASCYSRDPQAVDLCEAGLLRLRDGSLGAAGQQLASARRRDGGSPLVLEALASLQALRAEPGLARALAQEALAQPRPMTPTTQHRLLRTLLLARAALLPEQAPALDRELLTLGLVGQRERPHDPEPRLTTALAHNFLRDFAAAAALLRPLTARLPEHAFVRYHLGWAELGLGDAAAATAAFDQAARKLPLGATVVPRLLARYAMGDDDGVRQLLAELVQDPAVREGEALHELRRMQAAHALLRGDRARAADLIVSDLSWQLARPSGLEHRAGELAETGEVLVRIGQGQRLRPLLASIQQAFPNTALADAVSYLGGLVEVAATQRRAEAIEQALMRRGATVHAYSLEAFGHRQAGALAAEREALAQAARESASPLVKAALVRNLRISGEVARADALRDALRREMLDVDLRRRSRHPLLGPELALAFLVE